MTRNQLLKQMPIAIVSLTFASLLGTAVNAGTQEVGEKGAEIYCFMRSSGNDHEVSWNASYEVIKRQNNSLFKTSPKHAAVMIIESVVKNPNSFEDCGSYIGDLFGPSLPSTENMEVPTKTSTQTDRYSY